MLSSMRKTMTDMLSAASGDPESMIQHAISKGALDKTFLTENNLAEYFYTRNAEPKNRYLHDAIFAAQSSVVLFLLQECRVDSSRRLPCASGRRELQLDALEYAQGLKRTSCVDA